ncbi:MAG: carboxyltransferase domain-containing protein [Chitinophagaceae bacterium]
MQYYFISEQAFTIDFGNNQTLSKNISIHAIVQYFQKNPIEGIVDIVPSSETISFFFDIQLIPSSSESFAQSIFDVVQHLKIEPKLINSKEISIPICFDESLALDLMDVCNNTHLTKNAFKQLFLGNTYTVAHLGFLPGFPYITGLNTQLQLKRKDTPNPRVPAKSVAIANDKIGIYPFTTPGGWHIIGSIPFNLFSLNQANPFLFNEGFKVHFFEIDLPTYKATLEEQISSLSIPASKNPSLKIIKSIGINTIQSTPRLGHLSKGVPLGGFMLPSLANQLLSVIKISAVNPIIELAMGTLQIKVIKPFRFAFAGSIHVYINNMPQQQFNPISVKEGDDLNVVYNGNGIYGYMAFDGTINIPKILGSYSTSINAQLGYLIQKNDNLEIKKTSKLIAATANKPLMKSSVIRCFKAHEFDCLNDDSKQKIFASFFEMDVQANRMAIKLKSEKLVTHSPIEISSTAVTVGTVQLTPNGQLIVLMNDAQATGGYPRILQIAKVDIELLAMHKPGENIQFKLISFEEATQLLLLNYNS